MTKAAVLKEGINRLTANHIDNAAFDAKLLFFSAFSCTETEYLLEKDETASEAQITVFFERINKRINRMPLQYILGQWSFMGFDFFVGDGVLIPRPETELLTEMALSEIKSYEKPIIFDLCAGSGCIGLSIAKLIPTAEVYLVEKSAQAFNYLKKNFDAFALENSHIINDDIFNECSSIRHFVPNLIISNPPYIKSDELKALQTEVQFEPKEALDGGNDGLLFYRLLAEKWFKRLNPGGQMFLECGEGQSEKISELFKNTGNTNIINDYNGIERIIAVKKI